MIRGARVRSLFGLGAHRALLFGRRFAAQPARGALSAALETDLLLEVDLDCLTCCRLIG